MNKYKIPTIDDMDIEFRTMSAEEGDKFYFSLKNENNPYMEEFIFNTITDNKYADKDISAGVVPLVLYLSFKLSGIITKKEQFPDTIDKFRESMSKNAYYPIYAKIISTQNSYTLDQLKQKTFNEIMELYTFSELIDGKQLDTDKMREAIVQEEQIKSNPAKKGGVKNLSKEELDALKIALQTTSIYNPEAYI